MKRLIYLLLSLLGFGTACDGIKPPFDEVVPEYGVPYVEFHLSARVVDKDGSPIKGIEVHNNGYPLGYDAGGSDSDGNISIIDSWLWPDDRYEVEFIDPDGMANGGEFRRLKLDITDKIEEREFTDSEWSVTGYEAKLGEVVMEREDDGITN